MEDTSLAPLGSQLSNEQMLQRQTGIGASEIAAVCGLSPWATPLDIWMRKATPTRGPLVNDQLNSMPIKIGNALEDSLRAFYSAETGHPVFKPDETFRHGVHSFLLATPDGIVADDSRGLEIKVVGARMVQAWDESESGVPDYVELQCRQNMAILDLPRWDVAALLGGSDFRIATIERDLDLEAAMIDAACFFWDNYILTSIAPPEDDPERRKALLAALFPKSAVKVCVQPENPAAFAYLCRQYQQAKAELEAAEKCKKSLEMDLAFMVGENYGLESPDGKFIYASQAGQISYKDLAIELNGGPIPDALLAKHRGADIRKPYFTPAKDGPK